MKTKNCVMVMICLFFAIVAGYSNEAAGIGVSPGKISTPPLTRGGYYEEPILISSMSSKESSGYASAEGDIAQWVRIIPSKFNFSKENPAQIRVILEPPADLQNGNYNGSVLVVVSSEADFAGYTGATLSVGALVQIFTSVSDVEEIRCNIEGATISDAEKGDDTVLEIVTSNYGNVRLKPKAIIDIWNEKQTEIVKDLLVETEEVKPTLKQTTKIYIPTSDLEYGQYWVDLKMDECEQSKLLTFDVLEKGTTSAEGNLEQLVNKPFSMAGETIELIAVFANTGKKKVYATFKGVIQKEDSIAGIVESEEVEVPISGKVNLTAYFTPESGGRYIAKGRVYYEKKQTYEKYSVLNVLESEESKSSLFSTANGLLAVIIVVTIQVLLILIRRKRKKRGGR